MKELYFKLLEKIGLIPKKTNQNQPCYDKYGRFLGWFSRSVAVAVFVFCKDKDGKWYVLASQRGSGAADYHYYWNCPCGYIDRNDRSIVSGGVRELEEETGVRLEEDRFVFVGYDDSPHANLQNITFHFATFIEDKTIDQFSFSHSKNEKDEVDVIGWVLLNGVDGKAWAFNHDSLIKKISKTYL